MRAIAGNGERDGTRAGAQIGNAEFDTEGDAGQRKFDQQFGFGTRDQHIRRHQQIECPEAAMANQVGDRLAALARFHQRLVFVEMRLIGNEIGMAEQPGTLALQHMAEQDLGLVPCFDITARSRRVQQFANARHHATGGGGAGTSIVAGRSIRQGRQ